MKIIIDADACPRDALASCLELGAEFGVPVWTVASFKHDILSDRHITVGDAPQETDVKIANLARRGDIVVTQDWGLAAVVLGRGARALSPGGRVFKPETIDFLLAERDIKARFRRTGGRTPGPSRRTPADQRRFASSLRKLLAAGISPEGSK